MALPKRVKKGAWAMKKRPKLIIASLSLVAFNLLVSSPAKAEVNSGLTISPAELQLTIDKDFPVAKGAIGIRNESLSETEVVIEAADVSQIGDKLLISQSRSSQVVQLVELNNPVLKIGSKKSVNTLISVKDSERLGPGTHYFAILIKQKFTGTSEVGLSPAIQVLVTLNKEFGAVRSIKTSIIGPGKLSLSFPKAVDLVVSNTGNTTVVPRAAVYIKSGERDVAKGILNADSVPLLPGLDTKQRVSLEKLDKRMPTFGFITISATVRYDGSDAPQVINYRFLYMSKLTIVIWVIFMIALYLIIARKLRSRRKKLNKLHKEPPEPVIHQGQPHSPELTAELPANESPNRVKISVRSVSSTALKKPKKTKAKTSRQTSKKMQAKKPKKPRN